jgi:hypothetical protein
MPEQKYDLRERIDRDFQYHEPKIGQPARYEQIRVFAHQNDTMPDPDAPDRKAQKEQQRDPGLQSYRSGGEGGPASDPEQNLIIEDDPRYRQPKDRDEK